MHILVTGATGHLGCNLVRALLERGHTVRALIHTSRVGLDALPVEQVEGDVTDERSLLRAMDGIEVVYNCAGYISILRSEGARLVSVNVDGVRNVVSACRQAGVRRLVHFSSIHSLQQEPLDQPLDERKALVDDRRCPPYDLSKAAGERVIKQAVAEGLDAVIINPTGIIGPHDYRPSHIGQVLIDICQRRLPALIDAGFNWVDVRDVAAGSIAACEKAPAGSVFLLSGHWKSVGDIARAVSATTGVRVPSLALPLWFCRMGAPFTTAWAHLRHKRAVMTSVSLYALNSNRHISHAAATAQFGYEPRPFEETITDTLRWFASNGMIPHFDT